jgi:predicted AAA+ superfamily ATPase
VVVITGARQTGKSTLIHELLPVSGREYRTLDDIEILERAEREPDALVSGKAPLTLDEVQRSPRLLLAIKRAVDRGRRPGRFLLSGSANLALLGKVSETLAGRAVYLALYPFTLSERAGRGGAGAWRAVLDDPGAFEGEHPAFTDLTASLLTGGFPPVAPTADRTQRRAWLDGYVRTYLERDLQAFAAIDRLVDFRRLMRMAALRSGNVLNQSELARDAGLTQPTTHRYLNLLEASYLLHRLPAYAVNRTKRLVKSPKLYFCDTGLAAHLAGMETEADIERAGFKGALLETLVLSDVLVWREGLAPKPELLYWRSLAGAEVDFVIEHAGRIVPIEVKSNGRPRLADAKNLDAFLQEYGKAAPHGAILHTGTRAELIADRIWAIPLSAVLGLSPRSQRK